MSDMLPLGAPQQPPPVQAGAGQIDPRSALLASILQSMQGAPAQAAQPSGPAQALANALKQGGQQTMPGQMDPNAGGLVGMGMQLNPQWGAQ